jgi:uncharacterized membrane protein YoaT (DUF817 family)
MTETISSNISASIFPFKVFAELFCRKLHFLVFSIVSRQDNYLVRCISFTIRNVKLQLANELDLPEIICFERAGMFVIPIFFIAFDWNTAGYEAVTADLPF